MSIEKQMTVSGLIYQPAEDEMEAGFFRGWISIEKGRVVDVGEGKRKGDVEGIVVPTLVDAHVHMADGFITASLPPTVEEAVGPPNGLKHRFLKQASPADRISATRKGLKFLQSSGILDVADFREGGIKGIREAEEASKGAAQEGGRWHGRLLVLGRPKVEKNGNGRKEDNCGVIEEAKDILREGDGLGLPDLRSYHMEEMKEMRRLALYAGKIFSLHWSEAVSEPVEPILELKPDFVVHAVEASYKDMEALAEKNIGVVSCPGASVLFGRMPNLRHMMDAGLIVSLGTDNLMFGVPDMWETMRWAYRLSRKQREGKALTPGEVLWMGVEGGRKVLRTQGGLGIEIGEQTSLVVFRHSNIARLSEEEAASMVVNHGSPTGIVYIQRGEKVWKNTREY